MLAGLTVASLTSLRQSVQFTDVMGAVEQHDRWVRTHARTHGQSVQWAIDLDLGVIGAPEDAATGRRPYQLPRGYRVAEVRTIDVALNSGQIGIPYSAQGRSLDYGVLIVGPGDQRGWLVFAGLTGQCVRLPDGRRETDASAAVADRIDPERVLTVDQLFSILADARADAG